MLAVGTDLERRTPSLSTGRSFAEDGGKTIPLPRLFPHGALVTSGAWEVFEGKIAAHSQLKTGSISFEFICAYRRICVSYLLIGRLLGTGTQ